jgi:hypothetical protein
MRRRTWDIIWERIGIVLFVLFALAVFIYMALLIADLFTAHAPKRPF